MTSDPTPAAAIRLARRLFQAFQDGDDDTVHALCAPDCRAVQNGGRPMSMATLLRFSSRVRQVLTDFRYEDCRRVATSHGFVEEHRVRGTLPDGEAFDLAACIVADLHQGRITGLREYFDSRDSSALARLLAEAQAAPQSRAPR